MDRNTFYDKLKEYKALQHYGILGQKWGTRRWQNADGSFNDEGKIRYFGKFGTTKKKPSERIKEREANRDKIDPVHKYEGTFYFNVDNGFDSGNVEKALNKLINDVYPGIGEINKESRNMFLLMIKDMHYEYYKNGDFDRYSDDNEDKNKIVKELSEEYGMDEDSICKLIEFDNEVEELHDAWLDDVADTEWRQEDACKKLGLDWEDNDNFTESDWKDINKELENQFREEVKCDWYGLDYNYAEDKFGSQKGSSTKSKVNPNGTVFISGSSKTQFDDNDFYRAELPWPIQEQIMQYMKQGKTILVGDAPGIDRQVQDFLDDAGYKNVEIYSPGNKTRYSANSKWKVNHIEVPDASEGSDEWLRGKDEAMTNRATEGLAITIENGAQATRNNVNRLKSQDKNVNVFELKKDGSDNWIERRKE